MLFAVLFAASNVVGAPRPDWIKLGDRPGDQHLAEYFKLQTALIGDRCLNPLPDRASWEAQRAEYRRQLMEMLGLDPLPERTDLQVTVTGTIETDDFVVEKLYFQSMPRLYVTGNLYRPKELSGRVPAILYVCGHAGVRKEGISYGNKCAYQHHGVRFARLGYVCLVIDSVQLGEIEGIHHGTYRYGMWWWNNRGYTPAGVEAWNGMRAIDYLQSRPEVDPEKIGVTGRSGGGAYSWWIAAIDERVKAAVPVAGITDLADHVPDGCVEGHCDCMYIVNTYRWDYPMVAALIAPRALLIGNTDNDDIFPQDGVERLFEKVKNLYTVVGAADKVGLALYPGRHEDTEELQQAAFRWFDKHLKGIERPIEIPAEKPFQPEQLKVFAELPADQLNATIHEVFVPSASVPTVPDSLESWKNQSERWYGLLLEKSFRAWPHDTATADPRVTYRASGKGVTVLAVDFLSQPGVALRCYVITASEAASAGNVVLEVVDQEGWDRFVAAMRAGLPGVIDGDARVEPKLSLPEPSDELFRQLCGRLGGEVGALIIFPPRGIGPDAWNPNERKQVQIRRRFMLLGQSVEGMRIWDVRRAVQAVRRLPGFESRPLVLEGRGSAAGWALYAAVFEPNLAELRLSGLRARHRDGPIVLNVERFLDLPQVVAMVMERCPIWLETGEVDAWVYPRQVAERLGWLDRLEIVPVRQESANP